MSVDADTPADELPKRGRGRPRKYPDGYQAHRKAEAGMRTNAKALRLLERDLECVRLRKQGVDWDTIAERLDYSSRSHAHDRFVKVMRDYPRDDVVEMRDLEIERIEQAMAEMIAIMLDPTAKHPDRIRAAEVWNKLSERLARLGGLDKPERKELTVLTKDALTAEIERLEQEQDRKAQLAREQGIEAPAFD